MVGKTKMKDWRAAIRTWENNDPKKDSNLIMFDTKIEDMTPEQAEHYKRFKIKQE